MLRFGNKSGWIGIDAGASTLKVVQASSRHGAVRLDRVAVAPRSAALEAGASLTGGGVSHELATAVAIAGGFDGRSAAAVLSMSACDLSAGRRQPVGAAAPAGVAAICSDDWLADRPSGQADRPSSGDGWYTLSTAEDTADELCRDILTCGFSCRAIDGMPQALARAVTMSEPAASCAPIGFVDWGHTGALYGTVVDGAPAYVRRLRDCGLARLEQELADELSLDRAKVEEMMAAAASCGPDAPSASLIREVAGPLIERLGAELEKTLAHLRMHRKGLAPKKILLFGGGAWGGAAA
ncbi:MAG: hypothetical protein AAGB00_08255, partial [Planctomycetota bacterium]